MPSSIRSAPLSSNAFSTSRVLSSRGKPAVQYTFSTFLLFFLKSSDILLIIQMFVLPLLSYRFPYPYLPSRSDTAPQCPSHSAVSDPAPPAHAMIPAPV